VRAHLDLGQRMTITTSVVVVSEKQRITNL
jgi:hypothetical protein